MNEKLRHLIQNMPEKEPAEKLKTAILTRIERERTRVIKRKLWLSYAAIALSTAAILYALFTAGNALIHSEFWSLATLTFSDALTVARDWKDFLYSLLETLPVFDLSALIVPIAALFLSLSFYAGIRNDFPGKGFGNPA
ncbi:MAG: hypothetical protein P4L62_02455 [Candidatus Pacebacteria bacterium]|nr:hypothetical protein [Candidatus Paceibacterota bacterium]MDR3583195.1 hypothetical protein [Candidatus Paceibacterota bacterium]